MTEKAQLLSRPVEHIDITRHESSRWSKRCGSMAFTARDLARAADILDRMLGDEECGIILCLAGSLVSAGSEESLRRHDPHTAWSTRSSAPGPTSSTRISSRASASSIMSPRSGSRRASTTISSRDLHIDRIYDTLIDEDELRICDDTTRQIADELPPRPYSLARVHPRDGRLSDEHGKTGRQHRAGRPTRTTCRSSARRFPIARPASAWWPISTPAATEPKVSHRQRQGFLRTDAIEDQEPDRPACS